MPFYRNVKQSSGEQRPTMGFVTQGPVDTDIVRDAADGSAFSSVTINPLNHTNWIVPTRANDPTQDIGQYHDIRYINKTGFIDNWRAEIVESSSILISPYSSDIENNIMSIGGGRIGELYFRNLQTQVRVAALTHNGRYTFNDATYPNSLSASSGIDLGFSHNKRYVNYNFNLGNRWQVFKYEYSGGNQIVLTFNKSVSNFFYMSSNETKPAIGMWIRSYNGLNPNLEYAFYGGSSTYFKRYAFPSTNNYYMKSVSSDCKTFTLNKFGTGSGTAYFAVVFW